MECARGHYPHNQNSNKHCCKERPYPACPKAAYRHDRHACSSAGRSCFRYNPTTEWLIWLAILQQKQIQLNRKALSWNSVEHILALGGAGIAGHGAEAMFRGAEPLGGGAARRRKRADRGFMLPFARVEHGRPCSNEYCRNCRSQTMRPAQRCQHGSMTEPTEKSRKMTFTGRGRHIMSAPETYAESPVSCVFPAVPGTGEKVMPKKLHWKYLLYVLMVAYVLFVGTNMYQFNAMMEFVRQYPAEVSRETREMKTHVLEMRNTMPGLLSSPELTLDDIENIFTQQDDAQDRSLAKVRELLPEEQDKLDAVRQAFTDIRQVRRDAARTLQDNSDYNRAMEHYKRDIEPYAAKVHDALDDVFQVSENMTQRIQDEMLRRTNITILLSVIWGCAIIGALIYADRREQIKNREIAYREGLFSQLSQNVDEVFMIASDSRTFEYVSPNCIRLISLAASEISRTPEKLYTFLPPADGEWLKETFTLVMLKVLQYCR